jgi:RNA polymerase sigma factor (sigma-70 family)
MLLYAQDEVGAVTPELVEEVARRVGVEPATVNEVASYYSMLRRKPVARRAVMPRRAGLDEDGAAEVFQEVFTALLRKLDTIEDPDRLHAWLVTTARRITWKVISSAKAWQQLGDSGDDESAPDELSKIPDQSVLPDEALITLEEQHRIRTVVANLDERCRKLIELLFYQESALAYSEIAKALHIAEGSIGPTRARCLGKMLSLLERY